MAKTATKKITKSKVKRETSRLRPIVSTREGKLHMLASTGLGNGAIWSAMEAEYPQIIQNDARRLEVAGKVIPYDAEERGRVSRAINSTRGLAKKADDEAMQIVRLTGSDKATVKGVNDIDMANHHRFSWGIPALNYIYGETRFIHLDNAPNSKFKTVKKTIVERDAAGVPKEIQKTDTLWLSGDWRIGDPLIPLVKGKGYEITRAVDGTLRDLDLTRQIVEHGCPEAFMSIWGGEPGVGKSRLAIKTCKKVNESTREKTLYVNGELSEQKFRQLVGHDFDPDLFKVLSATKIPVDTIVKLAYELRPRLIVIDSVQTLAEWGKGNKGQQDALEILNALKQDPAAGKPHILLISQLNKAGELQGSRMLEHLADFVAEVTKTGKKHEFLLECTRKNRGGETPRGAIFRHVEHGVECVSTGDLVVDPIYKLAQPVSGIIAAGVVPPSDTPAPAAASSQVAADEDGNNDGEGD